MSWTYLEIYLLQSTQSSIGHFSNLRKNKDDSFYVFTVFMSFSNSTSIHFIWLFTKKMLFFCFLVVFENLCFELFELDYKYLMAFSSHIICQFLIECYKSTPPPSFIFALINCHINHFKSLLFLHLVQSSYRPT